MSIQAVSWALAQDISISSQKFVLVCLANYADPRGVCYPSQAQLCEDTGQDRKTVQLNITRLLNAGLLRDTGHRIGATKGVVVFKIIGIPESSTRHFVYRTYEPSTCEFYIGKRSFDGDPKLDVYRGSGRWVLEKLAKGATLIREIVSEHLTAAEALAAEVQLMREVEQDPLCKNEGTPIRHRLRTEQHADGRGPWVEDREKRDSLDREKRDSLDTEATPLFPVSDPKNGRKLPQKRGTEPSGTIKEPSGESKEPPADRRTSLPAGFAISERVRFWAKEKGFEAHLDLHLEHFLGHVKANRGRYVDWDEAFMNCIRADWGGVRRQAMGPTRRPSPGSNARAVAAQWAKDNADETS